MNIFTNFHKDWTTIVDFLLIAKFWASVLFFVHPLHQTNSVLTQPLVIVEGVQANLRLAQNLAINKKSTIVVQSL